MPLTRERVRNRLVPKTIAVVLSASATLVVARAARAEDLKQACSAAYQETQTARREGRLRSAYDNAVICAQSACPEFVKVECATWLNQIDASLPTVVFDARDAAGRETAAVRVLVDGKVIRERLDGKAAPIDPGEHTFRYELPGAPFVEEHLVIHEAEKNRRISILFKEMPKPVVIASPEVEAPRPRTAVYVLGAVAVVSGGLFATFGILGRVGRSHLVDTCAPGCSPAKVDAVRAELITADVNLSIGVVAVGVATYLLVSGPSKPRSPGVSLLRAFGAAPRPGGAFAAWRTEF